MHDERCVVNCKASSDYLRRWSVTGRLFETSCKMDPPPICIHPCEVDSVIGLLDARTLRVEMFGGA